MAQMTSAQKMIASAIPSPHTHQWIPDPKYDPIAITS
jgi:hypothetical protein